MEGERVSRAWARHPQRARLLRTIGPSSMSQAYRRGKAEGRRWRGGGRRTPDQSKQALVRQMTSCQQHTWRPREAHYLTSRSHRHQYVLAWTPLSLSTAATELANATFKTSQSASPRRATLNPPARTDRSLRSIGTFPVRSYSHSFYCILLNRYPGPSMTEVLVSNFLLLSPWC